MISPSPSIVWFQSDLRLADNPALSAAVRRGQPLICLYVWNPKTTDYGRPGAASRWWLHYSLQSLSANLQNVGNRLLIRMGHTHAVLLDLLKSIKNAHVFWNRSCEPTALESERHILNLIKTKKVQGTGFYGNNLVDSASNQNPDSKTLSGIHTILEAAPSPAAVVPSTSRSQDTSPTTLRHPQVLTIGFTAIASDD